jgi:hypothetical protein
MMNSKLFHLLLFVIASQLIKPSGKIKKDDIKNFLPLENRLLGVFSNVSSLKTLQFEANIIIFLHNCLLDDNGV